MNRLLTTGALVILLFDLAGSLASEALDFFYAWLTVGSFLIYALFGFFAARLDGLKYAAVAGGVVALVESTAGWALSWAIGPGRPPDGYTGLLPLIGTVAVVVVTGVGIGLLGGAILRFVTKETQVTA